MRNATWNGKILEDNTKDEGNSSINVFSSKTRKTAKKREGMTHWCWSHGVMTLELYSTCFPPKGLMQTNCVQQSHSIRKC